jgi:Zn-dependent protease with chaperone function
LHNRDISNYEKLARVRGSLGLSADFAGFVHEEVSKIDLAGLAGGKPFMEGILEPSEELTVWTANLVFIAVREGRFIVRSTLKGLDSGEYEHPFDRSALNALKNTPGLELVVRKFNEYGVDKLLRIQYTGSNIKVKENTFPYLYTALRRVCDILDMNKIPDLYVEQGPTVNAFTAGVEKPILVVSAGCINLLTYDELLFVLAHEAGHIKSQHVLYHQMASVIPILGNIIGSATLGIGNLVSTGLQVALLNWQRKSEFTADRAGLLACQDIRTAVTAMMKIAGFPPRYYDRINPDDFLEQAKEFEEYDHDTLDKVAKILSVMSATHPWTVMRGLEMSKWIESGAYNTIMERHKDWAKTPPPPSPAVANRQGFYCTRCGTFLTAGDIFCKNCGNRVAG